MILVGIDPAASAFYLRWLASCWDRGRLGWGPVQTGIFHVADLAVIAGVALLILERPDAEASGDG